MTLNNDIRQFSFQIVTTLLGIKFHMRNCKPYVHLAQYMVSRTIVVDMSDDSIFKLHRRTEPWIETQDSTLTGMPM